MYKDKKFIIKPIEDIKSDIDAFRALYKNRAVEKIFLADGDALVVPTDILIQVLDYIKDCLLYTSIFKGQQYMLKMVQQTIN